MAEQGTEHLIAKWITAEKTSVGLGHAVVRFNETGKVKERIAQSTRARAGLLAIADQPQVAQTCILRAFGLQMSCRFSLALRLFCFVFVLVFMLSLKPRSFVQSFFNTQAPRQPHAVT